jgi:hypothetical protein
MNRMGYAVLGGLGCLGGLGVLTASKWSHDETCLGRASIVFNNSIRDRDRPVPNLLKEKVEGAISIPYSLEITGCPASMVPRCIATSKSIPNTIYLRPRYVSDDANMVRALEDALGLKYEPCFIDRLFPPSKEERMRDLLLLIESESLANDKRTILIIDNVRLPTPSPSPPTSSTSSTSTPAINRFKSWVSGCSKGRSNISVILATLQDKSDFSNLHTMLHDVRTLPKDAAIQYVKSCLLHRGFADDIADTYTKEVLDILGYGLEELSSLCSSGSSVECLKKDLRVLQKQLSENIRHHLRYIWLDHDSVDWPLMAVLLKTLANEGAVKVKPSLRVPIDILLDHDIVVENDGMIHPTSVPASDAIKKFVKKYIDA